MVVDVEHGDFILEAGIRDSQPGGAARDDDLKPVLWSLIRRKLEFAFVVRDEEANSARVGDWDVVLQNGRVVGLVGVLGRVGEELHVVDGAVGLLNSKQGSLANVRK